MAGNERGVFVDRVHRAAECVELNNRGDELAPHVLDLLDNRAHGVRDQVTGRNLTQRVFEQACRLVGGGQRAGQLADFPLQYLYLVLARREGAGQLRACLPSGGGKGCHRSARLCDLLLDGLHRAHTERAEGVVDALGGLLGFVSGLFDLGLGLLQRVLPELDVLGSLQQLLRFGGLFLEGVLVSEFALGRRQNLGLSGQLLGGVGRVDQGFSLFLPCVVGSCRFALGGRVLLRGTRRIPLGQRLGLQRRLSTGQQVGHRLLFDSEQAVGLRHLLDGRRALVGRLRAGLQRYEQAPFRLRHVLGGHTKGFCSGGRFTKGVRLLLQRLGQPVGLRCALFDLRFLLALRADGSGNLGVGFLLVLS